MRELTDAELAHLEQGPHRAMHADLERRANATFAWGTLGMDLLLRPSGELIAHQWTWEDPEGGGALREVVDAGQRARMLTLLAAADPALAQLALAEDAVGCETCLALLRRGILIMECGHHGGPPGAG